MDGQFQQQILAVGVGIGATKTIAKFANQLAKCLPDATGVQTLDGPRDLDRALSLVSLDKLWNVAAGTVRRLARIGVTTPRPLRDADPYAASDVLGIAGQRIVCELRGEPRIGLEPERPDRQHICCSSSFDTVTGVQDEMFEAVATSASLAATKLRRQDLTTARVGMFVQTDRHAPVEQYTAWCAVRLPPGPTPRISMQGRARARIDASRYDSACERDPLAIGTCRSRSASLRRQQRVHHRRQERVEQPPADGRQPAGVLEDAG